MYAQPSGYTRSGVIEMSDVPWARTSRNESTTTTTDECPLCRDHVADSPYPRHMIILQDESDTAQNRRIERRLCHSCWEALFSDLSE